MRLEPSSKELEELEVTNIEIWNPSEDCGSPENSEGRALQAQADQGSTWGVNIHFGDRNRNTIVNVYNHSSPVC